MSDAVLVTLIAVVGTAPSSVMRRTAAHPDRMALDGGWS